MDFLKNKKVLIIIFIFIFVILAALNFYNIKDTIKNNVIEPFEAELDEDQNVGENRVIIDNTDNVNFNSFGATKTNTNLTNLLKTAGNWNLSWNVYNKNSFASNEGGAISLGNPNKSDDNTKVDNWTLFNMTGNYGDGLHFYKYAGGIANNDNPKFKNRGSQLILYDNSWSKFFGPLVSGTDFYADANCYIKGSLKVGNMWIDGVTINAAGGRMHITGTELLYILNKDGVIIGKEWGGNGNLVVQGVLTVNGKTNTPGGIESGLIKSNSTLEVTGLATLRGGVSSTSATFSGDLTVNGKINGNLSSSKIVGTLDITAVNKYSTDTNAWWRNNGTGSFVIASSTVPAAQGCIKIETTHWDQFNSTETFSTINCKGRLHLFSSELIILMGQTTMIHKSPSVGASGNLYVQGQFSVDGETYLNNRLYVNNEIRASPGAANPNLHLVTNRNMFLMAADNVYIYKETSSDYWNKPSGNLIVQGIFSANQDAYIGGGLNAPRTYISNATNEGGHICLINTKKISDNNKVYNWTIFNMTEGYGNGLHFWKYCGEGSKFLIKGTQFALWDNGMSQFKGGLVVDDSLSVAGNTTIGGILYGSYLYSGRVHIHSTTDHIHLLARQFVIVDRDSGWGTGGILIVHVAVQSRSYQMYSDIRLKENIKTISETEKDKVLQLVPKTFNMIDDEKKTKRYGFIAQEVEELYPEFIYTNDKGMKTVNYIDLIPLLLEQIKELKKSIPNPTVVNTNAVNTNVLNIGGVTLNATELQKLKQLLNQ